MALYFRAIAIDFDGTLAEGGGPPAAATLEALRRARRAGCAIILATGRILHELAEVFPGFAAHFDAVVAENGAVLSVCGGERLLVPPVPPELGARIRQAGHEVRNGTVLLACHAAAGPVAAAEIHRMGLDSQLAFNRSELMIVPAGVTKGTGVAEALGELDISPHNAIAVGDAENDLSMFAECELGVAVANAVGSVRHLADVVMDRPAGRGVAELLDGPIVQSGRKAFSDRRRVQLGQRSNGSRVELPAAQINLLVCGDSGSGKSHLAGLFAERVIALGYCVLVIDPEGDHLGLARLRDTIRYAVGDWDGGSLPPPARVVATLHERLTSVVLDLSGMTEPGRTEYLTELGTEVALQRHAYGLPHWVITDEAQDAPEAVLPTARIPSQSNWGHVLVSWQPDRLEEQTLAELDAVLVVAGPTPPSDGIVGVAARVSRTSLAETSRRLSDLGPGTAFLAALPSVAPSTSFNVATRLTQHVRHWHKYANRKLTPDRWFYFRDLGDVPAGVAANLAELHFGLAHCPVGVVEHHCRSGDLSRWLAAVFQDRVLASHLADLEAGVARGDMSVESARVEILSAIRRRYGV